MIKSSLHFSLGTLCSRISGLLREAILSYNFGASPLFDAFIIGLRIPNLLRDMLAEGALSQAFTKVYSEVKHHSPAAGAPLLTNCTVFFSIVSLLFVMLGMIFAEEIVLMFTLLTAGNKQTLVADSTFLTRLLFPYLLFAVISSIFMGALHQEGRFFRSAIAPIVLNCGFIVGALVLAKLFPRLVFLPIPEHLLAISGLAVGVLIGAALHCWLLGSMLASKLQWKNFSSLKVSKLRWQKFSFSPELKRVILLMLPMTLAYSAAPINAFINTNFAAALEAGVVSWLYYAFRLVHLPIGLFAVAVGIVVLPKLTRALQDKNFQQARQMFWQAEEMVLWLMALCLIYTLGNSLPITQFIYQHGSFSAADSEQTHTALYMYSLGLFGYGLLKVLTAVYYAINRTAFAMQATLAMIVVNVAGNYVLVEHWGMKGLALTSSIVVSLNAILLLWGLRKENLQASAAAIGRCFCYLAVFMLLAFVAQSVATALLEQVAITNLKLRAMTTLLCNAMLVATLFTAALTLYRRARRPFP